MTKGCMNFWHISWIGFSFQVSGVSSAAGLKSGRFDR
jgi:hypothetical protein